jgi:RNA polymerase sigma factor (sigma-70 family)
MLGENGIVNRQSILLGCRGMSRLAIERIAGWESRLDESSEDLVVRARNGDRTAFGALVRRFERMALAVAHAVVGNGAAAGDVAQEAFLRAWRRMGQLDKPETFGSWLAAIVRNIALDHCRRKRLEPGGLRIAGREAHDPAAQMEAREQSRLVNAALAELDEVTRTAVTLRYFDGKSSKEIGELLGLSAAAVDMRISRGRAALKLKLSATNSILSGEK